MTCKISNRKALAEKTRQAKEKAALHAKTVEELTAERDAAIKELYGTLTPDLAKALAPFIETTAREDSAVLEFAEKISKVSKQIEQDKVLLTQIDTHMDSNTALDWLGSKMLVWNKGPGKILRDTDLSTAKWIAARIWGSPEGTGGRLRDVGDASNWTNVAKSVLLSKLLPKYRSIIWEDGVKAGKWALQSLQEAERSGAQHAGVKQMNKDVFLELNNRRLGRTGTAGLVKNMADHVSDMYKELDSRLREVGAVQSTLPAHHVELEFKRNAMKKAKEKLGEDGLHELFSKGFRSSGSTKTEADHLARMLLKRINEAGDESGNHTMSWDKPLSGLRNDLDLATEHNGVQIVDLLNTEIMHLLDRSVNRASAWYGLAKATKGTITGPGDLAALQELMVAEGKYKGTDIAKLEQINTDYFDRLFGRPVRGGVPHEIRNLMQLGVYTKMGKAGGSQLCDTGQAAIKSMYDIFDKEYIDHILAQTKAGTRSELGAEMNAITGMMDGLAEIMWHGRHLDEAKLEEISELRLMSYKISDMLTGYNVHPAMSRILGKLNFQDVIQKYQSRFLMHSWLNQTARHFTGRGSKISIGRQMEVGVMDKFGIDVDLEVAFKHAEFDEHGNITKLNWEKWSPEAKDKLTYGIMKTEAQEVQRVLTGDMPTWMNSIPAQILTQFKHFSIIAANKQTLRQMRHADAEAVISLVINTAMTVTVKTAQASLGTMAMNVVTKKDILDSVGENFGADAKTLVKYNMLTGFAGDAWDIFDTVHDTTKQSWNGQYGVAANTSMKYLEMTPAIGVAHDMYGVAHGKIGKEHEDRLDYARNLMMLGNVYLIDWISKELVKQIRKGNVRTS